MVDLGKGDFTQAGPILEVKSFYIPNDFQSQ